MVDATMYGVNQKVAKADALNSHAEGRVSLDARNDTEYGMARTFIRIAWVRSSGSDDNSGSQPRRGQWFNGLSQSYGALQTGFQASNAFVQLGGFTAGRTESQAWVGPTLQQRTATVGSNGRVNLLQYTAALGSGMSLTGAVEDAAELRNGIFGAAPTAGLTYTTVASTATTAAGSTTQGTGGDTNNISNRFPDAIASFDVSQAWGTFKLAGVLHNVQPQDNVGVDSKTGWAGMTQTKILLPSLAAGDNILFHGAYGVGTTGRTFGNVVTDTNPTNASATMNVLSVGVYDGVQLNNTLSLSKSYSFGAQFQHYFTPTVSAYVAGNYAAVSYGANATKTVGLSGKLPHDFSMMAAELGVIWTPVAGLEINPSVAYGKATLKVAEVDGFNSAKNLKSDDQYGVRLRVARSF